MLHCKTDQRDSGSTESNQVNLYKPIGRAGRAFTHDETRDGFYQMRERDQSILDIRFCLGKNIIKYSLLF